MFHLQERCGGEGSEPAHREVDSESCEIEPNLDGNHAFPVGLVAWVR